MSDAVTAARSNCVWPHPGDRDVAAHLSRINRLRHLAIHTVEAFPRRRGITIDGVIYQRARHQTQQRREELNE
jgi:hypothetical protein